MTRENFLGFGCSATTLLNDSFKINTFDVESYIRRTSSAMLPTALTLHFSQRQRMVYYLFWTLYSMRLDRDAFKGFFGKELSSCYGTELGLAERLGLVRREPEGFRMTTKGSYYYHYFESYYTLSYIDQMWNLMRTEAFPKRLVIS
jgi:oxygen-independent coproporphyrinogen-3 oxidase